MRKYLVFITLLIAITSQVNGRDNFDSLWTVWNDKTQSDTNRLNAIYVISWNQFMFSQPDSAFYWAQKHYDLAKSKGVEAQMAQALATQGVSFYIRSNYGQASKYYHKSLAIYEKISDKKGESGMLNNIGLIYKEQRDYDKALEYYKKSWKLKKEADDKWGLSAAYNNIGNIYSLKGDDTKALEYHYKSLALKDEIEDKKGEAVALNNIGNILRDQSKFDEAIQYYINGLAIFEELQHMKGIAGTNNNLGVVYMYMKDYSKTLIYSEKALRISTEIGLTPEIKEAALALYEVNKEMGNHKRALEMHELFISCRDSIQSDESRKDVIRQEYKYQYETQKLIDDAAYEKQLAIEQEAKEKQQIITFATASGMGLVGLFLIFVFNRLQVTRKQKKVIEEQKEVVETAHYQLEEKNQEIMDSIAYAKRIQNAILPPSKVVKEYLQNSFILYKPKDIVAGDFYWMEHTGSKVLFAAADCTGHGVPGAMVSVVCNNALNRSVREHGLTDPGEILNKAREIVIQEFEKSDEEVKDGMDIALCSLEGNKLSYAGAHNPLWLISKGEIIETKANKQPIGKFDQQLPYTTHQFELQKGDTLYIFSDGYVDQFGGEKGKKFKARAFRALLLSIQDKSMEEQKNIIDTTFETWRGDLEQIDDVCVIGVRI